MSGVPQRRPAHLDIGRATLADWPVIRGWAADEGWNPGLADGASFFAQDPDGFFLGRIDGEPVSAVSVVNYGDDYAFLGCYLVRPDLRGLGHGIATWNAGLPHAGRRTIGLDGVVTQQSNYRKSGFELAHRTVRFSGIPAGGGAAPANGAVPVHDVGSLIAYDSGCWPADRPRFLESWLATEGHVVRARVVGGRITGYGVLREAEDMPRIGPLFADAPEDAATLFDALAPADRPVCLDVPASNPAAVVLAEARGLEPGFETARMYTGPVRDFAAERVFGVTTLELG